MQTTQGCSIRILSSSSIVRHVEPADSDARHWKDSSPPSSPPTRHATTTGKSIGNLRKTGDRGQLRNECSTSCDPRDCTARERPGNGGAGKWLSPTTLGNQPGPARVFTVAKRNTLWVGDITSVPTGQGLYLAAVIDAWSRKVVCFDAPMHCQGLWRVVLFRCWC